MVCNSYEILGVSPHAPMEVVRAAYLKLARCHHPDKLGHLDIIERNQHEAIFKEITSAYSDIVKVRSTDNTGTSGQSADAFMRAWSAPKRPEEWEAIWEGVERMFAKTEVLCTVKDLFMKASSLKRAWTAATAGRPPSTGTGSSCDSSSADSDESADSDDDKEVTGRASAQAPPLAGTHKATLMVSAADVQSGRKRKVRLLLSEGAVNLNVDCGAFPGVYCEDGVEIKLVINEDEATEFEAGTWDLFKTARVNLADWLTGCDYVFDSLVEGGVSLIVCIPACHVVDSPICVNDMVHWKYGPIYVSVALDLPKKEDWDIIHRDMQEKVLEVLRDTVCIGGKNQKST